MIWYSTGYQNAIAASDAWAEQRTNRFNRSWTPVVPRTKSRLSWPDLVLDIRKVSDTGNRLDHVTGDNLFCSGRCYLFHLIVDQSSGHAAILNYISTFFNYHLLFSSYVLSILSPGPFATVAFNILSIHSQLIISSSLCRTGF